MSSLFKLAFNFAASLLSKAGYGGVFSLMFLESATLPVPSEVVLPLTGYLIFSGQMSFWPAVLAATAGSLLGTLLDYGLGFWLGKPVILRYGKYIRLDERMLETTEKWFASHGTLVVLFARFVPLLRTLVAFPAGFARMNPVKFLVWSLGGVLVWDIVLIYLGERFSQSVTALSQNLYGAFAYIEIAVAIVIVLTLVLYIIRSQSPYASGKPERA